MLSNIASKWLHFDLAIRINLAKLDKANKKTNNNKNCDHNQNHKCLNKMVRNVNKAQCWNCNKKGYYSKIA